MGIFDNDNKKRGLLETGIFNTYNNVLGNFKSYEEMMQPLNDASANNPYIGRMYNPSFADTYNKATQYPEYITKGPSNFEKIKSLFGYQGPSMAQKMAVYDMVNNLSDAELDAYYLDKDKFMSNYINQIFEGPKKRETITDSRGRPLFADDLTQVIPFDRGDLRTFEVDGILYDYDKPDPNSPTGYAQVSKDDKRDFANLQEWQVETLNNADKREIQLKALPENDPNRISGLREIENIRRVILGEDTIDDYSPSGLDDPENPALSPVDKKWSIGDRKFFNEELSKSAMSMSNAMQVKGLFQPTFLESGGKGKFFWNEFLEKTNPQAGVNNRNEVFKDSFGNTYMNQLTGQPYTNGEMFDDQSLFYANTLQAQNQMIRNQTGAVMNINETVRILKSMPDTGLASPDTEGLFGLPKKLLGGDTPFQFAVKQDDVMNDLARVHLRTSIILTNQLAQPDISVNYLYKGTDTEANRISLQDWYNLSKEEQLEEWKTVYNNPEEVGEFRETPFKWSGGLYKDGSEMTLDSIWLPHQEIRNGLIYYPPEKQEGYIPNEITQLTNEIIANGGNSGFYDNYLESSNTTVADILSSTKSDKAKFNIIWGMVAYPKILSNYGLQPDALSYNGSGISNRMKKYQKDNTQRN